MTQVDYIRQQLSAALTPARLEIEVVDAATGKYHVTVASEQFNGKGRLQRHRSVMSALRMEDPDVAANIHALTLDLSGTE